MIPLYDTNPHGRFPLLTVLIIAVNVLVMFWLSSLPGPRQGRPDQMMAVVRWGFIPARLAQLRDPQREVRVPLEPLENPRFRGPWRQPVPVVVLKAEPRQIYASLLTMMFLHGNWFHLASNMWFLWIFGNNIEDRLGHVTFGVFYLIGGLLALFCHFLSEPSSNVPVIGASGAVAAVLGAYAITFPRAYVRTLFFIIIITIIDVPALLFLGLWFLQQLMEALGMLRLGLNGGVAWWAHVGGFVAGLVLMPLLAIGEGPTDRSWQSEADELFRS
jgi:membrane associated rhomboid family serine protease